MQRQELLRLGARLHRPRERLQWKACLSTLNIRHAAITRGDLDILSALSLLATKRESTTIAVSIASAGMQIREAREGELQALSVEKYLDALCVYFWAATSILTSIITFTLYALLGYRLTADVVFTSLALFNVLIVPLNGFPWVRLSLGPARAARGDIV